ncbi:MAG: flavin reductase family protein [Candidatus Nanopelagicaceae bacterium]
MEYLHPEVDPESFKSVMSTWPTGVAIITSLRDDDGSGPLGILCNSLTSISLEKRLLLWTVDHASGSYPYWIKAEKWVVHFLADDQQELVKRFAQKGVPDKFAGLEFQRREDGIPLLDGVVARLHCTTTQRVATHDHTIILGEVDAMQRCAKSPIVYALREFLPLKSSEKS